MIRLQNIRCELKLSRRYNSFGFSAEGTLEEADALKYFVLLKTLNFMNEFEKLEAMQKQERWDYVSKKLEELKFGWVLNEDGFLVKPEMCGMPSEDKE